MPVIYTRDRLAEAVRHSETLTEAIERLGRRSTRGSRAHVRRLLRVWGIDSSHLGHESVRHTERRLREAVRDSRSVQEVVRRLGISPVGGNAAHIGRRIVALGIDTSHFTVPRSSKGGCRDPLVLRDPARGRVPGERLRRALIGSGTAERCADCGTGPEWCGRPLRLEVDHIDGRWWDNRPANLRLLCPNCHAATDTFRGRKRPRPSSMGSRA